MAYDDNGRLRSEDELRANNQNVEVKSNYNYIIGGVIVLAIILGALVMLPHRTDNEAVNGQPATTTGMGTTSPMTSPAPSSTGSPARPAPPAAPGAPSTR
ncbi:MAG TPA: hypothetical protein VGM57_11595 [Pseudolabrys sp.]|jgi:hypothetical protein